MKTYNHIQLYTTVAYPQSLHRISVSKEGVAKEAGLITMIVVTYNHLMFESLPSLEGITQVSSRYLSKILFKYCDSENKTVTSHCI